MNRRRPRLISPVADFSVSVAALGSASAERLVQGLVQHVAVAPEKAPFVTGTNVRVLRTRGFAAYPPLALFYTFDDDAVYPLHVEPYELSW